MPLHTTPPTNTFNQVPQLPDHLEHKPVFALPYEGMDGRSAGQTDTKYISLGLAQWDRKEVSIKTMRHTGDRWSRQSEELPLNRVIDMTLFLAKAVFDETSGSTTLPSGTMQNQGLTNLTVEIEPVSATEFSQYHAAIALEKPILQERLDSLLNVLTDMKKRGKF